LTIECPSNGHSLTIECPTNDSQEKETDKNKKQTRGEVAQVVECYQQHHPKAKPGDKERAKIRDRLAEGFTVDDLLLAIEGCHKSPFHCGDNKENRKYQSLELIVRDTTRVSQFIELAGTEANRKRAGPDPKLQVESLRKRLIKSGVDDARDWNDDRIIKESKALIEQATA